MRAQFLSYAATQPKLKYYTETIIQGIAVLSRFSEHGCDGSPTIPVNTTGITHARTFSARPSVL